ncbi:MAG: hypothetical protein IT463_12260 [Planctomycetes bacterium]|nr:hypothetical protein [Planctomycetota bacterium]
MDLSAVPYLIVSRELPDGPRVFVCLCLLDHMVVGLGTSRDQAMQAMLAELDAKYGNGDQPELDILSRN